MKLCAIYNVYDGLELLRGSIEQIRSVVDCVVVVSQQVSNFGEKDYSVYPYIDTLIGQGLVDAQIRYNPKRGKPAQSETAKRQMGIRWARDQGYTHFLCMDVDEYYDTDQFQTAKDLIQHYGYGGSACSIWTYYKRPTLRLEKLDNYFVPFIHEFFDRTPTLTGRSSTTNYPCKVDPTRGVNFPGRFFQIPSEICVMHHYSWVRADIEKKIKNSTARINIDNSKVRSDYENAKAGYFVSGFEQRLVEVRNKFGIDDFKQDGKNVSEHIRPGR